MQFQKSSLTASQYPCRGAFLGYKELVIETLINTVLALGSTLRSTNTGTPQATGTEIQSVRNIESKLVSLGNQWHEQLEEMTEDTKGLERQADWGQLRKKWKAWVTRTTTLGREAHGFFAKRQTEVTSIKGRLQAEYASAILAQVENPATQLGAAVSVRRAVSEDGVQ